MNELMRYARDLKRPRALIAAARFSVARAGKNLAGKTAPFGENGLIELESRMNFSRLAGDKLYQPARHIAVLAEIIRLAS